VARGAGEHLPAGAVHRSHEAMLAPLRAVVERGRADGVFREDVPAEWLLSMYFALVHGADEHAAGHGIARETYAQRQFFPVGGGTAPLDRPWDEEPWS